MEWLRVRNMVFAKRQGFSLVEGMLAVAAFGLVTSAIATAVAYGQQSASLAGQRERAALLADKTLEAVRSIAFDDWKNIEDATASTNYGLALSGGKWTLSGTSSAQDSYTQTVSFTDLCRDTTTHALTVCTGSNRDPQSRRVTATITWTGLYNFERSVSITTDMTNWGSTVWEQSDWVGGANQSVWSDVTKYDSDGGNLTVSTAGQVNLNVSSGETGKGCGAKVYDFSTAGQYTTSNSDITVASGTAALTAYGTAIDANTVGLWHANDAASPLLSATGNNSLTQAGNSWVYSGTGKFATAIGSGDGVGEYWQIADASQVGLEGMAALTLEGWYKTGSSVNAGVDVLISKYGTGYATRSYMLQWNNGVNGSANIGFGISNGTSDVVLTSSQFAIAANTWYHLAAVYDGTNMRVYLNGTNVGSRLWSGAVNNTAMPFSIGGNSTATTNSMPVGALLDEVRVSNTARYNANFTVATAPHGLYYASTKPTVQPAASYDPVVTDRWQGFTEVATKSGAAQIYYQLSDDDGATWKWWNGSAWATASTATDYNTATTINTNITTFSTTNTKLLWRAFFVTNGSDNISLDTVTVTCVQTENLDFTTPAEYTATTGAEVSSGAARLTSSGTAVDANTIGLWHFNESASPFVDYSANNNPITNYSFSLAQTGKYDFGVSGTAAGYGKLGFSNQVGLDISNTDFTFDFWVYKTSYSSQSDIIKKWGGASASNEYRMYMNSSGNVIFEVAAGTGTTAALISNGVIPLNTWTHVAAVYDDLPAQDASGYNSYMYLYINGAFDKSRPTIYTSLINPTAEVTFGSVITTGLRGRLDEFRISNTARWTGTSGQVFTPETLPYGLSYVTTSPTVSNVTALTAADITSWQAFTETKTVQNNSTVTYQLSNDGTNWKYWNGSAWAAATTTAHTNAGSAINTNITSFTTTGTTLYVKTFLNSNGADAASVDNIEITYLQNPETDVTVGGGGGGSGTSTITSSAFDMGANTNITNVEWDEPATPCDGITCVVKLELRTAPDNSGVPGTWTSWYGATTAGSFFTDRTGTLVPSALQGNRWVQYRATLDNTGGGSPQLDEVRIFYD